MIVGALKEATRGETRVAATPATVAQLIRWATTSSSSRAPERRRRFPDEAYVEAGATHRRRARPRTSCFGVNAPSTEQLDRLKQGATLIAILSPAPEPGAGRGPGAAADHRAGDGRGAADLARAVAGRAVVDGQHRRLPRGHRGRPRVRPVLHRPGHRRRQGAAGQGAASSAPASPGWPRSARPASLGAIVRATDPRPEVADQVESLGGEFLAVESRGGRGSATGYAKEMGDDYKAARGASCTPSRPRRRHHHHHRADPGPPGAEAHHRRDGRRR